MWHFGGTGEISPQLTGRIYVRVAVVASDPGLRIPSACVPRNHLAVILQRGGWGPT